MLKKGLAVAVILLFIGMNIVPSTAVQELKEKPSPISFDGNTLYVGGSGPNNYTSIQAAINDASDGDTVFVYNGTYYENIVVDKQINLIGKNMNTTIIDRDFMYDSVVWISSDWVNISGFTIQNSGRYDGISIDSNHCVISGNIIRDNNYCGICIINSSYNIISNNIIIDNGFDLGHGYGISLAWESNHNIICQNIICDNDEAGIRLFLSANNIISGNTIENNHGHGAIDLDHSCENNISENNIVGNSGSGVELRNFANNNLVFRNNIENNGYGVDLDGSFFNSVIENNFMKNFINAYFANSFATRWRENYWNRNRFAPKIIFGGIYSPGGGGIPFPWINIDWHPAKEPYDIG